MKPYLKIKDHSVSGESFELEFDTSLDMLSTRPQPEDLDKYYISEDYISHTDSNKTVIDKLYQIIKRYSLRKKERLISKYVVGEKTLLDVGAGTGDFLLETKNRSWVVEGVEPNRGAKDRANAKGIILHETLQSIKNKKYSIITLWHVLEHLPNLELQIKDLVSLLNDNGTLVVAVPNFKSYDAGHYKEFWAAYDVPRHLWHFSKSSIEKLFAAQGMKVVEIKPMVFDSFYVSLLSEKYKSGHTNFVKAFAVGLWSNLKGWRTKEYSSHIYILKRA
ncbi:class I SAM-dependent methyltransferase [Maribacter sp. TH_r10]|uniref:class I SAM-dependent methyltransferase n=1 Tax=Maribacter sp. TH_r10 TaxID=3082086 RepID=UPI002953CB3E|nr:class I SAM-dependent methyltransferase [Maribacter sp. TH_r10]MDV7137608.1 class I SAM-dependent methyltransferase [Maribacter sp. TH_r10]